MPRSARVGRREFLRLTAAETAAAVTGAWPGPAAGQGRPLKIGYVSPQTGPLAGFGEADTFIIAGVRRAAGRGLAIRNRTHPVEILVRDSQADPNRAAEVASRLILSDKVDLMLVASTPETTNPVSDQCEVNGTPAISSVCPWQPWFFGRGGKPETGFCPPAVAGASPSSSPTAAMRPTWPKSRWPRTAPHGCTGWSA